MDPQLIVALVSPEHVVPIAAGWQMAFVLTPTNQATLTEYVRAHRPELVLINMQTAQACRVTSEEWLTRSSLAEGQQPRQQLPGAPLKGTKLWTISPARRQVFRPDGKDCRLTAAEFRAFQLLLERGHDPVGRMDISKHVLGRPYRAGDRAVDILMHKLRVKLGNSAIVTIRGAGYAFAELPESEPTGPDRVDVHVTST